MNMLSEYNSDSTVKVYSSETNHNKKWGKGRHRYAWNERVSYIQPNVYGMSAGYISRLGGISGGRAPLNEIFLSSDERHRQVFFW